MDFAFSPRMEELRKRLLEFMDTRIYPSEATYLAEVTHQRWRQPPVMEELKHEARSRGLWNLFLPDDRWGAGLSNLEYAPLAEITGRSLFFAPEEVNCSAPDTGITCEAICRRSRSATSWCWKSPGGVTN